MRPHKNIVFGHGFGFASDFWQPMLPYFSEYNCILTEAHYFSQDKPNQSEIDYNDISIGIGHSLGFLKLCQLLPNAKYLIGINPFINFLGKSNLLRSSRMAEFDAFKENIHQFPKKTLKQFHRRCGVTFNQIDLDYINSKKLMSDLMLLTKPIKLDTEKKILVIHAKDDLVVPNHVIEDNFLDSQVTLHAFEKGKHGLGMTYPKAVSEVILDFIQ